ncbi:hypothetical protein KM043_005090 [Ampulex compressa]|nr:hypothetical protein KM043_005090 [Ampulex compressa]
MDFEASIVERLKKLKQWQLEQQERLFKHQELQRQMLSNEQDRMYKALEKSIQDFDIDECISYVHDLKETEDVINPIQLLDSSNRNNLSNIDTLIETSMEKSLNDESAFNKSNSCIENPDDSLIHVDTNMNYEKSFNYTTQSPVPLSKPIVELKSTNIYTGRNLLSKAIQNVEDVAHTPKRQKEPMMQFLMDGVTPLEPEKPVVNSLSIDDIPIPSPRKDFQTLLNERLKNCNAVSVTEINPEKKIRNIKPFLRKGQGLARFKPKNNFRSEKNMRQRNSSVSNSLQLDPKINSNHDNKRKTLPTVSKTVRMGKLPPQKLNLKNVPLPKKKVHSKSRTTFPVPTSTAQKQANTIELNISDPDTKSQRELEEVRIFELLEEKAENSSFCSTSSAVIAFLQQSTPFKVKRSGLAAESNANIRHKENSPLTKDVKNHSVFKQIIHSKAPMDQHQQTIQNCMSRSFSGAIDSHWDSTMFKEQKKAHLYLSTDKNMHDTHLNNKSLRNFCKNDVNGDPINTDGRTHAYDHCDTSVASEVDVSLHVRFSEYNEYKTIGLTDTSTISNESVMIKNFTDEKTWSDSVTPETSDVDEFSSRPESCRLQEIMKNEIQSKIQKQDILHCMKGEENCCDISVDRTNDNFVFNEKATQEVHNNDDGSEISDVTYQSLGEEQCLSDDRSSDQTILSNAYINKGQHFTEHNEDDDVKECVDALNKNTDKFISQSQMNTDDVNEDNEMIFKSELLKTQLLELKREIDIFRKQNAVLSSQQQKLREDHRKLNKEYEEKIRDFEECKKQAEDRIQEEKRKLMREKAALDSRMRDSQEKAQQSKQERQEVQQLRLQLEELKDEINLKESRWNAAQSRQRSQMRILKVENSKLKQEIARLQNQKNNAKTKKKITVSNTKAIHNINKQLNMTVKERTNHIVDSSSDSDQKLIRPMMESIGMGSNVIGVEKEISDSIKNNQMYKDSEVKIQKPADIVTDVIKKRNLYENLLRDATSSLIENQEKTVSTHIADRIKYKRNSHEKYDDEKHKMENSRLLLNHSTEHTSDYAMKCDVHSQKEKLDDITFVPNIIQTESSIEKQISNANIKNNSSSSPQEDYKIGNQSVKHIRHSDGHVEYWYPNGNIKKIFPEEGITKMIYYNGDVRETEKGGKIKYFYASTRTWHTTMPDGLEILEFPDGQIERRSCNGTVEVSFPDGSVRILESDGSEKWALQDGTFVETYANGEKILTLPNGQREIHTKDHKRREYPDGTVKLVYPDGTQETRYSNGRTRLKDKEGNLIMDSHQ